MVVKGSHNFGHNVCVDQIILGRKPECACVEASGTGLISSPLNRMFFVYPWTHAASPRVQGLTGRKAVMGQSGSIRATV